jgi:hypothetical protein
MCGDGTSEIELRMDGQGDGSLSYTVVQTRFGYLYVVLASTEGRLLYDVRTLAQSAEGAKAALVTALCEGVAAGEDPLAMLELVSPEELLARLMTALILRQTV